MFYIIHHLSLIVHTYPHTFGIPSVKVRSDNGVVTEKLGDQRPNWPPYSKKLTRVRMRVYLYKTVGHLVLLQGYYKGITWTRQEPVIDK